MPRRESRSSPTPVPSFRVAPGDDDAVEIPSAAGAYRRAELLAELISDLAAELTETREALRRREAELATGVPLVAPAGPDPHLADRLEAVLRTTAEAVGCRAAGLYLLDSATTELKLRVSWGLPSEQLLEAPRALAGAMADLEALAGHAVALEDTTGYGHWSLPYVCGSAVCVPVSSATTPMGTLWIFHEEARPFTDPEVNLVEIGAGRIAADLERELLLAEVQDVGQLRRNWDAAQDVRIARTPQVAPIVEGWEIAGCTTGDEAASGKVFDWLTAGDGELSTMVGRCDEQHFAAALGCESLRSAWRAHARHEADPARVAMLLNDDLWSSAIEPRAVHLIALRSDAVGAVSYVTAGEAGLLIVPQHAPWQLVDVAGLPLGVEGDAPYATRRLEPQVNDVLIAAADRRRLQQFVDDCRTGKLSTAGLRRSRDWLRALTGDAAGEPTAIVVLRRTT